MFSNYKTVRKMLDKSGTAYRVHTTSEGPALSISAGNFNPGVVGTYTTLQFNTKGALLYVGVWSSEKQVKAA